MVSLCQGKAAESILHALNLDALAGGTFPTLLSDGFAESEIRFHPHKGYWLFGPGEF